MTNTITPGPVFVELIPTDVMAVAESLVREYCYIHSSVEMTARIIMADRAARTPDQSRNGLVEATVRLLNALNALEHSWDTEESYNDFMRDVAPLAEAVRRELASK